MTASFTVGHSPLFAGTGLHTRLTHAGVTLREVAQATELQPDSLEVLLLDASLLRADDLSAWQTSGASLVAFDAPAGVLPLPPTAKWS